MNKKGLFISLVRKFLAAYLIVLPLLEKATNMEKQKTEYVLLTVLSEVFCVL